MEANFGEQLFSSRESKCTHDQKEHGLLNQQNELHYCGESGELGDTAFGWS